MLDKNDKRLLIQLQDCFPIDPQPYKIIAQRLHVCPDVVGRKVSLLLKRGIIRYIGAILDTKRIGFKSSLVALAVPISRIREVSGIINSYSQVTHNYLRDDEYNIWFTISAPTDKRREALIKRISNDTGVKKFLDLATIKVFKVNARFALGRNASSISATVADKRPINTNAADCLTDRQFFAALSSLALPLDNSDRPLQAIAQRLGCTEYAVSRLIAFGLEKKFIRRFGAVFDHYKIGLKTNALVAWQIRKADISSVAKIMLGVPNISHCYWRKTQPGWPYTLYTMIHALDRKQFNATLTLILRLIGHTMENARIMFTIKELKKTRFYC